MNERLIANWNACVQPDDTVWVLGDHDMHGKDASLALVTRLVGTKVLVAGNHDACWGGVREGRRQRDLHLGAGFDAVMDFAPVSGETLAQHLDDLRRGRVDAVKG